MRKTRTYTNYFWDVPFKQHLNVCHEPDPYIWEKKGLPPYESLNLCSFDALQYKTRYYYNSLLVWLAWQFKKLLTNLKIYKLFHATTIFHSAYLWANFRATAASSCCRCRSSFENHFARFVPKPFRYLALHECMYHVY